MYPAKFTVVAGLAVTASILGLGDLVRLCVLRVVEAMSLDLSAI